MSTTPGLTGGELRGTVFLDRDGTINRKARDGEYVTTPDEFVFLPGVIEALRFLTDQRLRVIVVTNQRGIALGRMTERALLAIHQFMLDELRSAGAHVHAIYHCPHEVGECRCRKPGIGLFLRARDEHPRVTWERSVMIGDSETDMEAAGRLGMRRALVGSHGRPAVTRLEADFSADTLTEASIWASDAIVHPDGRSASTVTSGGVRS